MPISVTCDCGARLEIDEKFLGKDIPCPDCGKPLPTRPPPTPPPLELPDNRRTSGLAVASLAVGLVGMFTFVGSLAAIALGIVAMRLISQSKKLDGINFARAGVAVGGVGILLTILILFTPLGLDEFLREFSYLGRISYSANDIEGRGGDIRIARPTAGRWASLETQSQNTVDDLIAVNVAADAFISCQHTARGLFDDDETIQKNVLEQLGKSELVNMLGRLNGRPPPEARTVTPAKAIDKENGEMTIDMRLGGIERRMLIIYNTKNRNRTFIFVGCARAHRFDGLVEQFREAAKDFPKRQP
jgi:Domain of unknown function (DUF4190)